MHFIVPFILTFLSFTSYSYLLSSYSFVHKDIIEIFQTSKTQLGFINGIIGFGSTFGVILFLMYSTKIKPKIVTYYTWSCIGYMFCYALILLSTMIWEHPSKVFLYILVTLIGVFRSIFMPAMMLMIKMHKEIYDQTNKINERNYKLLTNFWSVSFDVGMFISFFICNWLQYSIDFRWEYLIIVGILFMIVTTTMIFLGLRSYLEDHEDNMLVEGEPKHIKHTHQISFAGFFSLLDKDLPCKLYLVNSTIIGPLHLGFCFILPAFFYQSGYKGNQGYLTAIYSLFIVLGAWFLAVTDFGLHKVSEKIQKSKQKINIYLNQQQQPQEKPIFLYIFTISILLFAVTLIILTFISYDLQGKRNNGQSVDDSVVNLQIILMCCLGFFFGGPFKSYIAYRSIKTMEHLQKLYVRLEKDDQNFVIEEEKIVALRKKKQLGFWDKLKSHNLQIGTSLITLNRVLTHFTTFVLMIVAFYLIENHVSLTMGFLAFLGVLSFMFDLVQTIIAVKEQQNKVRQKQQLKNGINQKIMN